MNSWWETGGKDDLILGVESLKKNNTSWVFPICQHLKSSTLLKQRISWCVSELFDQGLVPGKKIEFENSIEGVVQAARPPMNGDHNVQNE